MTSSHVFSKDCSTWSISHFVSKTTSNFEQVKSKLKKKLQKTSGKMHIKQDEWKCSKDVIYRSYYTQEGKLTSIYSPSVVAAFARKLRFMRWAVYRTHILTKAYACNRTPKMARPAFYVILPFFLKFRLIGAIHIFREMLFKELVFYWFHHSLSLFFSNKISIIHWNGVVYTRKEKSI